MRTILAWAMTLVLVSVIALCPAIACPLVAGGETHFGSCCHHPQSQHGPCPPKTAPACPYSILQKSKSTSQLTHASSVIAIAAGATASLLPAGIITQAAPERLINSTGLFLRNCVLLI